MKILLSKLLLPLSIFWLLIIISAIFLLNKSRITKYIFSIALFWLLLICTPFIPDFLILKLENQYEVFKPDNLQNQKSSPHILILGSSYVHNPKLPANSQLSNVSVSRLVEGIRLHKQLPGSFLITSGLKLKNSKSEAELCAETAILLGVDATKIKMLVNSENTLGEANTYINTFGKTSQLILVTSAAHMPRAMYLFQKAGLNPIPAPTNFLIKNSGNKGFWFWLPHSQKIHQMETAIYEHIGLLWYKIKFSKE